MRFALNFPQMNISFQSVDCIWMETLNRNKDDTQTNGKWMNEDIFLIQLRMSVKRKTKKVFRYLPRFEAVKESQSIIFCYKTIKGKNRVINKFIDSHNDNSSIYWMQMTFCFEYDSHRKRVRKKNYLEGLFEVIYHLKALFDVIFPNQLI